MCVKGARSDAPPQLITRLELHEKMRASPPGRADHVVRQRQKPRRPSLGSGSVAEIERNSRQACDALKRAVRMGPNHTLTRFQTLRVFSEVSVYLGTSHSEKLIGGSICGVRVTARRDQAGLSGARVSVLKQE
ncbi:hypothetical protein NDU88_001961 [Pleurodeles waltl]|uniref:Uncharacterized protein n=1 Tax=Pleurodeles waltl TaxID=8319 RepID=A0AAV7Q4L7_PLEWA|nr:hypothetical protein NDU88_001961 [Pleurodeles waltl]